jgi:hypothetical protein
MALASRRSGGMTDVPGSPRMAFHGVSRANTPQMRLVWTGAVACTEPHYAGHGSKETTNHMCPTLKLGMDDVDIVREWVAKFGWKKLTGEGLELSLKSGSVQRATLSRVLRNHKSYVSDAETWHRHCARKEGVGGGGW